MKKVFVLLMAMIPYGFLGPYLDGVHHSLIGYGISILFIGSLWYLSKREELSPFTLGGSFISLVLSYFLSRHFLGVEWNDYFKPLTASHLAVAILIVSIGIQILSKIMRKNKKFKDKAEIE